MKNTSQLFLIVSLALSLCLQPALARTDDDPAKGYTRFKDHTVYYSVFNSTLITPEVARLHRITRAGNQVLINVAVVGNGNAFGGEPADVSGNATNLMQQRTELDFTPVVEGDVTYYLAPLRITNEETIHFTIDVVPNSGGGSYTVTFSKKVYVNQ